MLSKETSSKRKSIINKNKKSNICVFFSPSSLQKKKIKEDQDNQDNQDQEDQDEEEERTTIMKRLNQHSTNAITISNKILQIPNYHLYLMPVNTSEETMDQRHYIFTIYNAKSYNLVDFYDFFMQIEERDKLIFFVLSTYKYLLSSLQLLNMHNIHYMNLTRENIVINKCNNIPLLKNFDYFYLKTDITDTCNDKRININMLYLNLLHNLELLPTTDTFIKCFSQYLERENETMTETTMTAEIENILDTFYA